MKYLPVLWQLLYHSAVYMQICIQGTDSSSLLFCTDSCYLALFEVSVNCKLSYEQRMQCTCVALYRSAQQQSQDKSSECTLLNVNMSCVPGKCVNISIFIRFDSISYAAIQYVWLAAWNCCHSKLQDIFISLSNCQHCHSI